MNRPDPEDGSIIWNIQPDITAYELALLVQSSSCGFVWGVYASTAQLPPRAKRHLSLPPIDWSPRKQRSEKDKAIAHMQSIRRKNLNLEAIQPTQTP